jgi:serine/threonine protein kinase
MVRMLSQVAIGLDEAHGRNFIHRDLKPDNVFSAARARATCQAPRLRLGEGQSGNRKKLTVLGTTIGSPYYMAPEQAQGLETHRRARGRVRAWPPSSTSA